MKTTLLSASMLLFTAFATTSHAALFSLSGLMDPFQATTNPSNIGSGSGVISGDYDDTTNTLNYTLTWENLTTPVTVMHFHVGAPGVPGPVDLGVPAPLTSPKEGSGIVLSDTQESNLLSGNWYLNIHTQQFGGGEIRGQVGVTLIPEPMSLGLACLAASALATRRRR